MKLEKFEKAFELKKLIKNKKDQLQGEKKLLTHNLPDVDKDFVKCKIRGTEFTLPAKLFKEELDKKIKEREQEIADLEDEFTKL